MNNSDLTHILSILPAEPRLADVAYAIDDICPALLDHPAYKEWRRHSIAAEMNQNALIAELESRVEYIPEHYERSC